MGSAATITPQDPDRDPLRKPEMKGLSLPLAVVPLYQTTNNIGCININLKYKKTTQIRLQNANTQGHSDGGSSYNIMTE